MGAATRELLRQDYSAEAWVELAGMRDRFTKLVRHYTRRAYVGRKSQPSSASSGVPGAGEPGPGDCLTVDLEKVLGQILEVATSLMQARMGAVLLLDETKEFLEPVAEMGLSGPG